MRIAVGKRSFEDRLLLTGSFGCGSWTGVRLGHVTAEEFDQQLDATTHPS
jgi:hypothetical protein